MTLVGGWVLGLIKATLKDGGLFKSRTNKSKIKSSGSFLK